MPCLTLLCEPFGLGASFGWFTICVAIHALSFFVPCCVLPCLTPHPYSRVRSQFLRWGGWGLYVLLALWWWGQEYALADVRTQVTTPGLGGVVARNGGLATLVCLIAIGWFGASAKDNPNNESLLCAQTRFRWLLLPLCWVMLASSVVDLQASYLIATADRIWPPLTPTYRFCGPNIGLCGSPYACWRGVVERDSGSRLCGLHCRVEESDPLKLLSVCSHHSTDFECSVESHTGDFDTLRQGLFSAALLALAGLACLSWVTAMELQTDRDKWAAHRSVRYRVELMPILAPHLVPELVHIVEVYYENDG